MTCSENLDTRHPVEYSPCGRLVSWTERTGLERSYGYDPVGPLVSMTAPDGGVTYLTYLNGRLTS